MLTAQKKIFSRSQGFTLVEIVIYIALFAVISAVVINVYLTVLSTFTTTRSARDLLEAGSGAMERMAREIRQASSVNTSSSTLDTPPGSLSLASTDANGVSQTVLLSGAGGTLTISYNGVSYGTLINDNVTVTSLIFSRITTVQSEAVRIVLTLTDTRGKTPRSEKFYDTIVLRGGY